MYITRSQTRAANFVGICSKRATTGASTPGGIWQIGLGGRFVTIPCSRWSVASSHAPLSHE